MATTGRMTDEKIESQQNVDPGSDPTDAMTTGVEGKEETSTVVASSGVEEELERVRQERDQLTDRIARLQAEFDNARSVPISATLPSLEPSNSFCL